MKFIGNEKLRKYIEQCGTLRIMLVGETGVGKTPLARYSNKHLGKEYPRPFEQINCAGLSFETFQDQLFGHKRGAFTGAVCDKRGLVELADGGDLFLDEIGEMPLQAQSLLLTFLDNQQYYRLGDDVKRTANIRIISATNRNLKDAIEKGTFRKDLYSRLAQVEIQVPSLRERRQDIIPLMEHYIELFSGTKKEYSMTVRDFFLNNRWIEGNVRELKDIVEYMCTMASQESIIEKKHLRQDLDNVVPFPIHYLPEQEEPSIPEGGLIEILNRVECRVLAHYFNKHKCVETLEKVLCMSKPTIYRRMKKYGIVTEHPSDFYKSENQ